MLSRYEPFEIHAGSGKHLQDIADYIDHRLRRPPLSEVLARCGVLPADTAQLIASKGAGNFLYVVQTLEAIEADQIDPRQPAQFPNGPWVYTSSSSSGSFRSDPNIADTGQS